MRGTRARRTAEPSGRARDRTVDAPSAAVCFVRWISVHPSACRSVLIVGRHCHCTQSIPMVTDILTLLRRDHENHNKKHTTHHKHSKSLGHIRTALDGVR